VARTEERSGRGRAFAHLSELETKRLLLHKMRLDDAEAMFAYASDPEVTWCWTPATGVPYSSMPP